MNAWAIGPSCATHFGPATANCHRIVSSRLCVRCVSEAARSPRQLPGTYGPWQATIRRWCWQPGCSCSTGAEDSGTSRGARVGGVLHWAILVPLQSRPAATPSVIVSGPPWPDTINGRNTVPLAPTPFRCRDSLRRHSCGRYSESPMASSRKISSAACMISVSLVAPHFWASMYSKNMLRLS